MKEQKIHAIIPCAGFGTRMGMRSDQSKEMLPDADNENLPIIAHTIKSCLVMNFKPVFIVRSAKLDLIHYLHKVKKYIAPEIEIRQYKPTGEWTKTVLDNRDLWAEKNILILPDTRWKERYKALARAKYAFHRNYQLFIAFHFVNDPKNWGILKNGMIYEKPKNLEASTNESAWGLLGFDAPTGVELFSALNETKTFKYKDFKFWLHHLKSFEDITRQK